MIGTERGQSGEARRILYVEDDDDNWYVAQLALRGRYVVERAATAAEAVTRLRDEPWDLVLMDIELRGSDLDGIQIVKAMRGTDVDSNSALVRLITPASTPVVFVTAYGARYRRADLLAAGGSEVMQKPVDFGRLSLVIARLSAGVVTKGG